MTEHAYTYHGDGREWLAGVPARHLTDADVAALPPEAAEALHEHMRHHRGLYQRPKDRADRKSTARSGNRRRRATTAPVSESSTVASATEVAAASEQES